MGNKLIQLLHDEDSGGGFGFGGAAMINRMYANAPAEPPTMPKTLDVKADAPKSDAPAVDAPKVDTPPADTTIDRSAYEKLVVDHTAFKTEHEKLKGDYEALKSNDHVNFINELKADFAGTVAKYKDKFGLPDLSLVAKQVDTSLTISDKVAQYQTDTLPAAIAKKFGLESFDFENDYDVKDARKAGTPSAEWDKLSREYEENLSSINSRVQKAEADRAAEIRQIQDADMKSFADTFLAGDNAKVQQMLAEVSSAPDKILRKELPSDKHPYSIATILKGFYFETLAEQKVNAAVANVIKQFNDMGMTLPKDMPADLTKVPGGNGGLREEQPAGFRTPAARMMQNFNNKK